MLLRTRQQGRLLGISVCKRAVQRCTRDIRPKHLTPGLVVCLTTKTCKPTNMQQRPALRVQVLSVDASPATFKILQQNVKQLADVIEPINAAIVPESQAGTSLRFGSDEGQWWGAHVLADGETADVIQEVPGISLRQLAVRTSRLMRVCSNS